MGRSSRISLSIIIVNWNTKDLLRSCLASIPTAACSEEVEVIVVDNASRDGSADMVKSEFPQVTLIRENRNLGYAEGNNSGFRIATGDYLLTLNPDTELNRDSLNTPLEILHSDLTIGAVGIRQIGLDGQTQASVRGFPNFYGIAGDMLRIRRGKFDSYRLSVFDYSVEQEAPQPMGTFLLFSRCALEAIGSSTSPFDPNFPIFFNEVDLLFRLKAAGFRCLYTPRATLLHHGGESTKQVRPQMIWESHRSLIRFWRKHARSSKEKFGLAIISPLIYLGALVRARSFHAGFRA